MATTITPIIAPYSLICQKNCCVCEKPAKYTHFKNKNALSEGWMVCKSDSCDAVIIASKAAYENQAAGNWKRLFDELNIKPDLVFKVHRSNGTIEDNWTFNRLLHPIFEGETPKVPVTRGMYEKWIYISELKKWNDLSWVSYE